VHPRIYIAPKIKDAHARVFVCVCMGEGGKFLELLTVKLAMNSMPLCDTKAHHRFHKSPSFDATLNRLTLFHISTF